MALYVDEAEVWKCPKHPSRRRKSGICPKCLRERLVTLCPECATALPCSSCPPPVDSSSSSSSSSNSFSLFAFSRGGSRRDYAPPCTANADAVRLSNNLETEPSLRKSRSVAVPFLRSRSRFVGGPVAGCESRDAEIAPENNKALPKVSRSKINFWSVFTTNKSKKCDVHGEGMEDESNKFHDSPAVDDFSMMKRSRSVAVGASSAFGPSPSKRKGWYFPSPVKGILNSKPPKSVAVA
ncbi:unnamed protein product [Lactuca virosa]|uniref:Uncharacterized protein n=1 Tax=Lactuca virosa TaxID=75947 RepID=A0AAU9PM58_9ASTR|nr:unnamed protein product [Lactuca virosa]